MESLAVKYRPRTFEEICGQQSVIKILDKQIETKTFSNVMLFSGASGCGKTTLARIVANKINNGLGQPIEIDAASNNGVENVRMIIDNAQERSVDSEYKVFIIDECHMITTQGWNALLKTIEEPPQYTLFFFCTTEINKVPETIKNRCQWFKINRISDKLIWDRINNIALTEQYAPTVEGIDYIVKLANGSMRQAISYLDKCKDYNTILTLENVMACLGDYSYDTYFSLTDLLVDSNKVGVFNLIDYLYDQGSDLKAFVDSYLDFVIQLNKYCLLNSTEVCRIPSRYEEKIKYTTGIEDRINYFSKLLDKVLEIKVAIKNDSNIKTTIQAMLVSNG